MGLAFCLLAARCTKDKGISKTGGGECGTVATLPSWASTLNINQLAGNWKITSIYYSRGTGTVHSFDTSYSANQNIQLMANGNGILGPSIPIKWTYSSRQNNFPKMMFFKLNSLFSFSVSSFYNDSLDVSVDGYTDQGFFVTFGGGKNNDWEQGYMDFVKQ
jgi:hypothetical protein